MNLLFKGFYKPQFLLENMLPKVKFEFIDFKTEEDWLFLFCKSPKAGWGWGEKYIFQAHPLLKEQLKDAKSGKKRFEIIKKYIKYFWKENRGKLNIRKDLYQKEWDKISSKYMKALTEVIEIDWPKDRKTIRALVSINPTNPPFIEDFSFSIFYLYETKVMKEIVAHEILHLLYFEKWKKVFSNENIPDWPSLERHLSEILAPVILKDKIIQKVIKFKPEAYPEHKKVKIGEMNLIQHFEKLYEDSRERKELFAQFLQIAYKEAQKHKDKILKA